MITCHFSFRALNYCRFKVARASLLFFSAHFKNLHTILRGLLLRDKVEARDVLEARNLKMLKHAREGPLGKFNCFTIASKFVAQHSIQFKLMFPFSKCLHVWLHSTGFFQALSRKQSLIRQITR